MIYLFEGPDCCGKSTLIKAAISKAIDNKKNVQYIHCVKSDMNDRCQVELLDKLSKLSDRDDVFIDRNFVSNIVYQAVFQDGDQLSRSIINLSKKAIDKLILCVPADKGKYLERFEQSKQQRSEAYNIMNDVYDRFVDIVNDSNFIDNDKRFVYDMFEYTNKPEQFLIDCKLMEA